MVPQSKMSLTPFSRANMRLLKEQKDEEGHQRKLEQVVKNIYTDTLCFAERNTETIYLFRILNGYQIWVAIPSIIPSNHNLQLHYTFYQNNKLILIKTIF